MTAPPRKLIEVALPLPAINDASAYDRMPGNRPAPQRHPSLVGAAAATHRTRRSVVEESEGNEPP